MRPRDVFLRSLAWVAVLAVVAVGSCTKAHAACTYTGDRWTGSDKAQHLAIGGLIGFGGTLGTGSAWKGFAMGSAVGVLKEVSDAGGSGTCSAKDLMVTVIGAGVGAVIGKRAAVYVDRGTTWVVIGAEF
jgi:uncharacterized protein YfiM (DUF2279 family)